MKHFIAIIIKFILVTLISEVVLILMTELSFGSILIISLVITVLAYLIGDLLILPHSNNTVATVVDLVLSFLVIYLFNFVEGFVKKIDLTDAVVAAIAICIGEWFFHKYVSRRILSDDKSK